MLLLVVCLIPWVRLPRQKRAKRPLILWPYYLYCQQTEGQGCPGGGYCARFFFLPNDVGTRCTQYLAVPFFPFPLYLARHNRLCGQVHHATDGASVAGTELLEGLQVLAPQIQLEFNAELQVGQRLPSRVMRWPCCSCWPCGTAHSGHVVQMGAASWWGILVGSLVQGQVLEVALLANCSGRDHAVFE